MNTLRTIDDDMLSAFLDGELPAEEIQAVRAALANDAALAARLATLQRVNDLVTRHAQALDATPLPSRTLSLLQSAGTTATVVQGPWQRWSRHAGAQLALAATLVLTLGVAVSYLRSPAELPALAAYSGHLDNNPSGSTVTVDDATLVSRFSFRDREDRYCRQYQLGNATVAAEHVACRTEQGWTVVATLAVPVQAEIDAYQPASSSGELNALLDSMMQGAALDLATEAALIDRGWQQE